VFLPRRLLLAFALGIGTAARSFATAVGHPDREGTETNFTN
jgi:hypothetical protein